MSFSLSKWHKEGKTKVQTSSSEKQGKTGLVNKVCHSLLSTKRAHGESKKNKMCICI